MSRPDLDLSNLKDSDTEYLLQRPWLIQQAEQEGHTVPKRVYGETEEAEANEEHGFIPITDNDTPTPVTGENLDVEGEDEYDAWSKDDLITELQERELPHSGNKAELIARLREDDAAEEPEDDEDDEEPES